VSINVQLKEVREATDSYSGKASENARLLSAAGIALVWWLSDNDRKALTIPLLLTAGAMALVLALDLLHCITGYLVWDRVAVREEGAGKAPDDFTVADDHINRPIEFFFWSKLAVLAGGYALLAYNFYSAFRGLLEPKA
jgi:hypothetical protein